MPKKAQVGGKKKKKKNGRTRKGFSPGSSVGTHTAPNQSLMPPTVDQRSDQAAIEQAAAKELIGMYNLHLGMPVRNDLLARVPEVFTRPTVEQAKTFAGVEGSLEIKLPEAALAAAENFLNRTAGGGGPVAERLGAYYAYRGRLADAVRVWSLGGTKFLDAPCAWNAVRFLVAWRAARCSIIVVVASHLQLKDARDMSFCLFVRLGVRHQPHDRALFRARGTSNLTVMLTAIPFPPLAPALPENSRGWA